MYHAACIIKICSTYTFIGFYLRNIFHGTFCPIRVMKEEETFSFFACIYLFKTFIFINNFVAPDLSLLSM